MTTRPSRNDRVGIGMARSPLVGCAPAQVFPDALAIHCHARAGLQCGIVYTKNCLGLQCASRDRCGVVLWRRWIAGFGSGRARDARQWNVGSKKWTAREGVKRLRPLSQEMELISKSCLLMSWIAVCCGIGSSHQRSGANLVSAPRRAMRHTRGERYWR